MYFKILGPLEVEAEPDGSCLPLVAPNQRVLLCALLATPDEVVSLDRLIEWLWPRLPPKSAPAVIQTHISRLRRVLETERRPWSTPRVLLRHAYGYQVRVEPDELDALRFERLVAQGRAAYERGDPEAASRILTEALGLWRGSALCDVAPVGLAQVAIGRLEAMRMSATVLLIDADLALDRHSTLVPELEGLVRAHPLDERLCGQLMIALYRCGRQADSLGAYERVRAMLAEELDIRPAPASQRLQAAILAQEPCLDGNRWP